VGKRPQRSSASPTCRTRQSNVVQNFTADHDLAVKAARVPRASISTMDSPYLSLISLVKSWPQQNVRREVLMVSDGIDRL
jgi:hypothetical protein